MPTGSQDDIQIKAVGTSDVASASQSSGNPTQPAAATPVTQINLADSAVVPAVNPVTPAPAAPVSLAAAAQNQSTSDQSAQKPANQRAFNLDADVDTASTTTAKPDKFAIPKMVQEKYPDLVELVKTTESMDDEEREYWFQILPVMTDEQVEKFKSILVTEKQQLSDLDHEYEDELNRLNEKHLLEWKEFENKEKSKAIKEAEAADQAQQKQMEEELLAKLSDV